MKEEKHPVFWEDVGDFIRTVFYIGSMIFTVAVGAYFLLMWLFPELAPVPVENWADGLPLHCSIEYGLLFPGVSGIILPSKKLECEDQKGDFSLFSASTTTP